MSLLPTRAFAPVVPAARPLVQLGVVCVVAAAWTGPAGAYCRARTCDDGIQTCSFDARGCPEQGAALYWPTACVAYSVQEDGSPRRGIDAAEADAALTDAFARWLGAACGDTALPAVGAVNMGTVRCDRSEFNPPEAGRAGPPNANILIFRDASWSGNADTEFARTTLTFDAQSGAIVDADIELNTFTHDFVTEPGIDGVQLRAVLTHEVGHFLGLAHSSSAVATMHASYDPTDAGFLSLSPDDQEGICAIYPSDGAAVSCPGDSAPAHGFSRDCGADVSADASCLSVASSQPAPRALTWQWLLALVGVAVARRLPARRASRS